MSLIDPADREGLDNALMSPLHRHGIVQIKSTFMLIDHNSVFFQGLIAIAIELFGKQAFAGTKGIGGIDNDQIVFIFTTANKFQAILIMDGYPLIIKAALLRDESRGAHFKIGFESANDALFKHSITLTKETGV